MMVGGGRLSAVAEERMVFAELSQPASRKKDVAMTLKMDGFEIEIYNGADSEVIAHTIQALKNIC